MISVFTPSHRADWLDDCYLSLKAQTVDDWEWVVLLNGGAEWDPPGDRRVRVMAAQVAGVGAAKAAACAECRGDILVELDHDDLLASVALERIADTFTANPDAALVYSNCAQIQADGTRNDDRYRADYGWTYAEVDVDGRSVAAAQTMAPTPHNCSLIWFSPNHVKAFPRWAYDTAGGYDPDRWILDDQDLMCRLYQTGEFVQLTDCLYLQRVHDGNTQKDPETNAFIQRETVNLYDQHIAANALHWATRNRLLALDLGAAHAKPDGFLGVDCRPGPGVDLVATLPHPLELPDSCCGVIRAADFLEHVADQQALMAEIWRLLAPGGLLLSLTPSTDGRGAFQDPTHVAFWNENSFWYYTDPNLARYIPDSRARFQVSRLVTGYPSDWHREHQIPYVTANLIAVKPGMPRNGGPLNWAVP